MSERENSERQSSTSTADVNVNGSLLRGVVVGLALTVIVAAIVATGFVAARATSATPGPCAEAWQYPHSQRVSECRRAGWTINLNGIRQGYPRGVIVSPHAVPRYVNIPACKAEDGGPVLPCAWNIVADQSTGDGEGLAYWVDRQDRVRYVWRYPAVNGWRAVPRWLNRSLHDAGYGRNWLRWRYDSRHVDGELRLWAPDGRHVTIR
jgi:hypothetical protein